MGYFSGSSARVLIYYRMIIAVCPFYTWIRELRLITPVGVTGGLFVTLDIDVCGLVRECGVFICGYCDRGWGN